MKRVLPCLLAATLVIAAPTGVWAWGGSGHRFIGLAAAKALPADLPAFLHTPQAIDDIGEYALEPDNSKNAGKAHDLEMQAGHFVDLDEDGKLLGGPPLSALPPARDQYEKQLQAFGLNSWKIGYLPYSIIERWQILAKDFATWRVITAARANPAWPAHKAFYDAELRRREALILIHIGELAHYVGDGSQPLHTTQHFNGWGDFPNPKNYTQAKIHAPFEAEYVTANLSLPAVEAKMAPLAVCGCAVEQEVVAYLTATGHEVEPLYQLEKAGALKDGDARMTGFVATRLAAGASKTRDLVVEAWQASPNFVVGYRPMKVGDVVSGKVEPYDGLRNRD